MPPGFPNPFEWFAGLFGVPSSSKFADKTGLEEYRSLSTDIGKDLYAGADAVGKSVPYLEGALDTLSMGGYNAITGLTGEDIAQQELSTGERASRVLSSAVGIVLGKVVGEVLPKKLVNTFMGGKYTAVELADDTILYSAGQGSRGPGQFFSLDAPVSEVQARIDKAIRPTWPDGGISPIDTGFKVKVPAGTTVYIGEVAPQGAFYLGGTNQVVIPRSWLIKGLDILEKWDIIK